MLDRINPDNGTVVRISEHDNVNFDDDDMSHVLDEETSWWYFVTSVPFVMPYGMPWLLYSVNVDTGRFGATHHLLVPHTILGLSLIPPPSR